LPFRDFTLAARTLTRSPAFSLTAILTLAIGIGATTAIFSVAHAVLLRPLPYRDPDRLVVLYSDLRARNNLSMPFSNENFIDIRDGTTGSFDGLAAVVTSRQVLPGPDGTPEQVRAGAVTTNFFDVLGASVALGRDFQETDGLPQPPPQPGAGQGGAPAPPVPRAAILSHEYWQRRYGGDPAIVGQQIAGDNPGRPLIVGVLEPGFELLFPPADNMESRVDLWIANRLTYDNANRNTYGLRPIGRLKAGASLDRAQGEVERVAAVIRRDFTVYGTSDYHVRVEPMHGALVASVRPAVLALLGGGVFLLLIACANVANLLLVRASLRETEFAVRSALGGAVWQVVRPMIAEAVVLGVAGIAVGVALASAGVGALLALAPANLPRLDAVTMDPVVLAFAAASGLAAALLFGLAPAWRMLGLRVTDVLRGSGRTEGLGRGSLVRSTVVVAEVVLCFVLLVGTGLMVRSFIALQRIDPGFDPEGVLTFQLLGGRGGAEQRAASIRDLREALGALPGVTDVTASYPFPLAGDFSTIRWGTEEALADNTKYQAVDWQIVQPGYFETLRTTLREGRTFTDADSLSQRAVVVVDEVLAAKAFPNASAVGRRILIRIRTPEPEWVEVIGVVAHQRVTSLADPGREQVFFTDGFLGFGVTRKWAIRTAADPAGLTSQVRAEVARLDPRAVLTDVEPMTALVARSQAGTRFQLLLIGALAVVASLLVAVGLYGVLSTMVRQRTTELGVRMALGATPASILGLVFRHGLRLGVIGVTAGLAAALALTQLMRSMLVNIEPTDPATYLGIMVVFAVIAVASIWLPARRAAALNPTEALRGE